MPNATVYQGILFLETSIKTHSSTVSNEGTNNVFTTLDQINNPHIQ